MIDLVSVCSRIENASDTGIILIDFNISLSNSTISLKFSSGIKTFLIPALSLRISFPLNHL